MNQARHRIATDGTGRRIGTAVLAGLLGVMAANGALAGETGTTVDWVDTFGDQDEIRARLDAIWRIADRHYLRLMITDYTRSRTRTIEEEIIWQGDVIPAGASATGKLGFEIYEAAYEYAFIKSENLELTELRSTRLCR